MSGLRVGIDGEALRRPLSGVGHYVFQLCRELEALWPDAQFFAYARLPAERLALPSERWQLRQEPLPALRRIPSFAWLRTRGRQLAQADRLDVFWAGRTLHPRLPAPVRTVCTVHDLNHLLVPETMELPTRWSHRLWFAGDLERADAVLANSQGTAQRLRQRLGVAVDAVVTPGLAPHFRPPSEPESQTAAVRLAAVGIAPPYLLSVATLEPRKNVAGLLRAFVALKRAGELPAHRLVLVGARGWRQTTLERELAAACEFGVVIAGYVPDEMMPALYAGADALVCPSFYEGYGMPVLEARACGARVLVADVPELREAGGPHAIAVPPTLDGLRDGLKRVLATPRVAEADLARRHAWRAGALRLAAVLQGRPEAGPARPEAARSHP
ncbi:glycosyltransferase family 1 protein [uncultured Methylibium sp.]|uniref:glycosyltransferase family 4 protein n=1 Tax=uncultured Methylibium sp. TaxID=381093 RepID=UPI0025FADC1E|nr:glycosyltransferase family 1 protein [uncultured Methylibium sp.]